MLVLDLEELLFVHGLPHVEVYEVEGLYLAAEEFVV